mmetsp:Transcript_15604/g.20989  ORF Transcript_15604/g.20989 Transcript_15604/m.20989 type:complete len:206 (+) Transcript_15604:17-634(+)
MHESSSTYTNRALVGSPVSSSSTSLWLDTSPYSGAATICPNAEAPVPSVLLTASPVVIATNSSTEMRSFVVGEGGAGGEESSSGSSVTTSPPSVGPRNAWICSSVIPRSFMARYFAFRSRARSNMSSLPAFQPLMISRPAEPSSVNSVGKSSPSLSVLASLDQLPEESQSLASGSLQGLLLTDTLRPNDAEPKHENAAACREDEN